MNAPLRVPTRSMIGTERLEPRPAFDDCVPMQGAPKLKNYFESGRRSVFTRERDVTRSKVMPKFSGIQHGVLHAESAALRRLMLEGFGAFELGEPDRQNFPGRQ